MQEEFESVLRFLEIDIRIASFLLGNIKHSLQSVYTMHSIGGISITSQENNRL